MQCEVLDKTATWPYAKRCTFAGVVRIRFQTPTDIESLVVCPYHQRKAEDAGVLRSTSRVDEAGNPA